MTLNENEKYWNDVCKIGQGADCCKYLVMGNGFECAKDRAEFKRIIDENWEKQTHIAQGDNCEGYLNQPKKFDKRYEEPFEDDGAYAD